MTNSPEHPRSPRRRATVLRTSVATLSAAALVLTGCSGSDSGEQKDDTVIGALCNAFYSLAAAQTDAGNGRLLVGTHEYLVSAQDKLRAIEDDAEGDVEGQYATAKRLIDAAVDTTPDMTIQEQLTSDAEIPQLTIEGGAEGVESFFSFTEGLEGEQREQFDAAPVCGAFAADVDVPEDKVVTAYIDFMNLTQGESLRDNEEFGRVIEILPLENPPLPGTELPDISSDDYRVIADAIGGIADGFEEWKIPEDVTDAERRALDPLVWHRPKLAETYRAAADAAAAMAENPTEDSFYALISAALESGTASTRAVRMVPPPNNATVEELVAQQAAANGDRAPENPEAETTGDASAEAPEGQDPDIAEVAPQIPEQAPEIQDPGYAGQESTEQ
ncbi:hypothetical protein JIM95_002205 [Corynebacterium sp. CCM 8835]|uniref:Secreted protein n=1 Tax=Corynebacterium antarcticum TaxID=2800405 RepID=A0ABS1FJI0_9CORY|nr:hypothetical protein [Corynebacterium antarcticum]MCK7641738.1 hypothetical protein [Corynebacterium antarcticum]MCK7660166.1 hypothetical protein [Corynebacterium antarcticum]MCL0244967.1 hypothetical protein [Corynebacterium antarcticum]MCX7491340.1 hypothetical protein [Corynebacterium antarcticum]MCX7539481.1 hypothetical protein [Corynebacterium antarcticum]